MYFIFTLHQRRRYITVSTKTMKQPTMKDVAKLAGVSQPTVSHVINGTASISDEVSQRVKQAIEEIGYVPNAYAKNLRNNKSSIIGLVVPDVGIRYYAEMVQSIEVGLRKRGLMVFLCNSFYDTNLELSYIRTLVEHNVLGVIIGTDLLNEKSRDLLQKQNIPVVLLDAGTRGDELFNVKVDNRALTKIAVQHLYDVGARHISYISEPIIGTVLGLRYEYFKQACEELGIPADERICFIAKNNYDKVNKTKTGYNLAANILLNKEIDAVFCSSDELAFGVIKRITEYGVVIPDDILIIGCDNDPFSSLITPKLTTIWQPLAEMVDIGINTISQLIDGEELNEMVVRIEPNIIIRESTMKIRK